MQPVASRAGTDGARGCVPTLLLAAAVLHAARRYTRLVVAGQDVFGCTGTSGT